MNAALALTANSLVGSCVASPARSAGRVAPRRVDLGQDAAWLAQFRAGERGALERVFRVYAPYVSAILRSGTAHAGGGTCHVGDAEERQDLMQEVFVRVLGPVMRARYDQAYPYTAFLRGVVRNVMVEHVRRKLRHAGRCVTLEEGMEPVLEHWAVGQPLPDELFASRAERQLMAEFLATLTRAQRRFADVRFEGGLSQRDAAEALGLGRQQVRRMEAELRAGLEAFLAARQPRVACAD
jgi:RNA polymerase sigma-70 factor (ECF subfamily)